jgi:NAD(P)-dependent dehydrogenase (short-subunit alcohol dehydrogenase family)
MPNSVISPRDISDSQLSGNVAVVTGSASGIGQALCQLLLERGIRIVALDRDAAKATRCHQQLRDAYPHAHIEPHTVDLADQAAVQAVAARIRAQHAQVHFLFHNAGALLAAPQYSAQGNELHFEINTLAPIALSVALQQPLAAAGSAAVVVSGSGARRMAQRLRVAELRRPAHFKKMTGPYAQSKQAVYLAFAAMEPAFLARGTQLRVVDLPPTRTAMARSDGMPGWLRHFAFLFASPERAALRLLNAALQPPNGAAFAPGAAEAASTEALLALIHQCGVQTA